ncbi:hypothetical protein KDH_56510 [Dictyobacter sp. S3.2.2.5]|uniref:3-keto-disaccharide hydrolase domain-containing protein n=2 Tax=Dictyobacter halimunensis TaxID=3026934 RepID=A0ABQ6G2G9_9CHLR|nr:hypothetical protein KDH_56510 [Dictyobacter sp. S3.2.2.5]
MQVGEPGTAQPFTQTHSQPRASNATGQSPAYSQPWQPSSPPASWNAASQPLPPSPMPTWNATSQPLQFSPAPNWKLNQPLQSSPVAGTLRRSSMVNQRNRSGRKRKQTFIWVGVSICVLLLVTLAGYVFVQNYNQATVTQPALIYPTPVPTLPALKVTDPQTLYQQAIVRKPLLTDKLAAQDSYDWEPVNTNASGKCTFTGQALHATSVQGNQAVLCLEQALQFDNIAFQAQVTIRQGDTAGLVIRSNKTGEQLYLFGITTTGRYLLASAQKKTGEQTKVIAGGLSPAIQQGLNQPNQLTIIARQQTLYLYVNGQYLTKVNDATASKGQVGFFSGDSQHNVPEAAFNQSHVWGI